MSQARAQSSITNDLGPNLGGSCASRSPLHSTSNRLSGITNKYKSPQLVRTQSASISEPVQKTAALKACKRCNARHHRCDRASPMCTKCEEDGAECSYVDEPRTEDRACKRCNVRHFRCDRATPMCTKCEEDGAECNYTGGSRTEELLHANISAALDVTTSSLYQRPRDTKVTPRNSLQDASSESEYDSSDINARTRTEENSDTPNEGTSTSIKKKNSISPVLPFNQAPDSVKNALMEWSRTYGREWELKCAVRSRDRKPHIDCTREGQPVSYFKDAQRLVVKMYRLPESLVSGLKDSIIVANASHSTHAFIISFKGYARGSSQFQIWHGIGAAGVDGFEISPSVKKYTPLRSRAKGPSEDNRQYNSAPKKTAAIKTPSPLVTASSTSKEMRAPLTETPIGATPVPRNWDVAVEISREGGCTTGTWTLREESRCRKHLLDLIGNNYYPRWIWFFEASKRLRAEGIKRDANFVKQVWHRKLRSRYEHATQDSNNAEKKVYAQDPTDSSASEAMPSPKVSVSKSALNGSSGKRSSLPGTNVSVNEPGVKNSSGMRSSLPVAKRARIESDHATKHTADVIEKSNLRGDEPLHEVSRTPLVENINKDFNQVVVQIPENTRAPSRLPALQNDAPASPQIRRSVSKDALPNPPPQPATRPPASAKLNEHILDNVVCIFQNQRGKSPRVRPFRSCDSTQLLFTHAEVGEVFGDEKKPVKTLTISLGSNVTMSTRTSLNLVENDEEDFETLKQMIMDVGWFYESDGGVIRGSGTLEVRAMS